MGLIRKFRPSAEKKVEVGDEPDVDLDEACGVECCGLSRHPISSLQRFATPKGALLMIGFGAIVQGFIVNGHTNAVISTIERRFELSSTESGLIASCYDIASCIAVLFVTYVGGRGHKPLWLGWGIVVMGIGSVVFSLPHFFAPSYTFTNDLNTCGNPAMGSCTISSIKNFRLVFYLAMILVGFGATPLYTLGITYLDENVKQRMSAFYNGCLVAFSIFGPGIGFLVGAALLRIYTNPEEEVTITESNDHWVGAWWIGALAVGIVSFFVALPVLMLPRQLPGTEKVRRSRETEMDARAVADEEFGKRFRDFPRCLWILVQNPTFVAMGLGGAVDSLLINGLATFGPKYMETIYGLDPSEAGIYFGLLAILGGAGGQVIGGGLLSRFNVSMRTMLHITYIAPLISMLTALAFLIHCDDANFAGVNTAYNSSLSQVINLTDLCNLNCPCNSDVFSPVCGSDKVTYYSSCFAGCSTRNDSSFSDCSCIPGGGNATMGTCTETGCGSGGLFILFCIVMFILMFFTFVNEASTLQVSLRCVAFNQRSFGIGFQWLLIRFIGMIPGPLILGAIIDSTCDYWSEECGERGSCLSYSSQKMSLYFFLFVILIKLVDAGIFLAGMWMYKPKVDDTTETSSNRHLNSASEGTSEHSRGSVKENGHAVVAKQPERNGSTKSDLPGEIPSNGNGQTNGFFDNPAFATNEV